MYVFKNAILRISDYAFAQQKESKKDNSVVLSVMANSHTPQQAQPAFAAA
ncbi:hypothetical protein [Brucella melitensis]